MLKLFIVTFLFFCCFLSVYFLPVFLHFFAYFRRLIQRRMLHFPCHVVARRLFVLGVTSIIQSLASVQMSHRQLNNVTFPLLGHRQSLFRCVFLCSFVYEYVYTVICSLTNQSISPTRCSRNSEAKVSELILNCHHYSDSAEPGQDNFLTILERQQ